MLIVDNCIVSEDIAECRFACPLHCCKGQCCVDGDAGAPVLESEVALMQEALPAVEPFMTPEGLSAVRSQGVAVLAPDGDLVTPLVNGQECAFVAWTADGTALCAFEMAFRQQLSAFMKPVSCHLYPIRVDDFGEFQAVNYHKWDICRCAVAEGKANGEPLYRYLKEPLIRRFGLEWYQELAAQCESWIESRK